MNGLSVFLPKSTDVAYDNPWGYGKLYVSVTPYKYSDSIEKIIAEFQIKPPFNHVITREDGKSVCLSCGQNYVGDQLACYKDVYWFRVGDYNWKQGNLSKGESVKQNWGRLEVVTDTKLAPCNGRTVWDKKDEFDAQEHFFNFVEKMGYINKESTSDMIKYSETLPEGMASEYRMRHLETQVSNLTFELNKYRNAIEQIVSKMNQAGHVLIF